MKKQHLFLTALAAVAIMLCSCVSEMEISVEQVYSVGVFESEFTPNDSVLVLKYLGASPCVSKAIACMAATAPVTKPWPTSRSAFRLPTWTRCRSATTAVSNTPLHATDKPTHRHTKRLWSMSAHSTTNEKNKKHLKSVAIINFLIYFCQVKSIYVQTNI